MSALCKNVLAKKERHTSKLKRSKRRRNCDLFLPLLTGLYIKRTCIKEKPKNRKKFCLFSRIYLRNKIYLLLHSACASPPRCISPKKRLLLFFFFFLQGYIIWWVIHEHPYFGRQLKSGFLRHICFSSSTVAQTYSPPTKTI